MQPIQLSFDEMLYEPGQPQPWVHFPDGAIISLLYVMENGSSAEIATVGNDGLLGVSLFMGGGTTPSSAVVHSASPAQRMKGATCYDGRSRRLESCSAPARSITTAVASKF
ncbi:MAG: hypothetical protein ABI128_01095 [Rhodanobacter sp.]